MTSIEFYERDTVIKRIKDNLNQINRNYFEGNHGILSVTDNGDYVTVCSRTGNRHFDIQSLFDALENFSEEDCAKFYDLWDYLQSCEYIPENQETENDDDELSLSFSEKRQVALVDMLLSEPAPITEYSSLNEWTIGLIPHSQTIDTKASTLSELVEELEQENENNYQECLKYITSEKTYLNKYIKQLQEEYQELERKNEQLSEQLTVLNETMVQLSIRVYKLEEENKQLKNNQLEVETKVKPEPKPTAKKRPKFKLPEAFADYQQECDDLINALSCFYDIKKGKWSGNILQFILIPTDTEKTKHPYPDKWKAGLYLQPGQWAVDKVNMSDPDDWEDWFMDISDFADSNDIEIS